jgi:hypothetical protein
MDCQLWILQLFHLGWKKPEVLDLSLTFA